MYIGVCYTPPELPRYFYEHEQQNVNRIAEVVKRLFPEVNKLISSTKKVFVEVPLRIQAYKKKLPNVHLPPEPILIRWGSWIKAALYYTTYFSSVKKVVESFNSSDSLAIGKVIL